MDKRIIGASLVCLAVLAICVVLTADVSYADEEETENPVIRLHGIIYDIPAEKDRVVIEGVTVTTWTSPNNPFETVTTDEKGEFLVSYDDNVKYISFTLEEFTVKGVCSDLHSYGDSGLYAIILGENPTQFEGTHDLYDSDGFTALISRTSALVYGTVTTMVADVEKPVKGAEVTLTTNKGVLRTETDSDGAFSIVGSSGVSYQMKVTANGLVTWTEEVTPSEEPINILMDEKSHDLFLGMDLAHTIAIFGLLIVLLVAIITIYLIRRPEKMDGLYVVNDLEPIKPKKKNGDL